MLKILRNKKTAKKVWIGLAIIIIPAFAFWGFGGSSRDQKDNAPIGKIFGRAISNQEFKDSLLAVKTTALMQFGDKLPEIEKYLNLKAQAWERLILLYEAKKRKIRISDSELIKEIQNIPYFKDKSGFNNKIYTEILRYSFGLQPRIFEEQTRQSLILAKLYKQVTEGVKLSEEQVRQEYLKINQELSIYYISSLFAEFSKTINPNDNEIASFFEKNKAMFKEPPLGDKPAGIPELTQVKDKVKEALINERAQKEAEVKIKECLEKLKTMDLNAAAYSCGLKSDSTAFFKSSDEIKDLGPAGIFWESANQLKDNQISNILSDNKGYYIIKLKSIKPIDEDKFAKEKEDFSNSLLSNRKSQEFTKFSEELIKKAQ